MLREAAPVSGGSGERGKRAALDFSVLKKEKKVAGGEAVARRRVRARRGEGWEANGKAKTATWLLRARGAEQAPAEASGGTAISK